MKKLVFLFWAIATSVLYAQSISAPQVKWQFTTNDSISGSLIGIVENNNHNFVVLFNNTVGNFILEEIDSVGNVFWQTNLGPIYFPPSTSGFRFNSLKKTSDGYIVCGIKYYAQYYPDSIAVTKVDISGSISWSKTYSNPSSFHSPLSIELLGNNSYVISGVRGNGTGNLNVQKNSFLMAIDNAGTLLWSKNYYLNSSATYSHAHNLTSVQKIIKLKNGFGQLVQLKYGTYLSSGSYYFLRTNSIGDSVYSYHLPTLFLPTSFTKSNFDNSLMFIGRNYSDSTSNQNFSIVKLDSNGLFMFRKDFSFPYINGGFSSITAKNNSDFVVLFPGNGNNVNFSTTFCVRINQNGDTVWTKKIAGSLGYSFYSTSLLVTSDNGCVIAGAMNDSISGYTETAPLFLLKLAPDPLDLQNSVHSLEQGSADWSIYPNPTIDEVTLQLQNFTGQEDITFSLYDIAGKLLLTQKVQSEKSVFSLKDFPSGYYLFKISNKQIEKSGKLVLVR